jgi:hypothetical protein
VGRAGGDAGEAEEREEVVERSGHEVQFGAEEVIATGETEGWMG